MRNRLLSDTLTLIGRHRKVLIIAVSLTFMSVCSMVTLWPAILAFANTQDATVYPYLLDDYRLNDTILPGNHPNFLKFPIFILQALLPYTFETYALLNIALALTSLALWCLLARALFKCRFFPVICVALACLIVSSYAFSINFAETTIRNIEYPLAIYFVYLTYRYFFASKSEQPRKVWYSAVVALFVIAVASDSLLAYVVCAPLVVCCLVAAAKHHASRRRAVAAIGLTLSIIVAGAAVRKIIELTGLFDFYYSPQFTPRLISLEHLWPSISTALRQVLDLSGARPWGFSDIGWLPIRLFNFFGVILGTIGLGMMLYSALRHYLSPKKDHGEQTGPMPLFMRLYLPLVAGSTLAAYILSDQVFMYLDDGQAIDGGQSRYITLLPLLCIVGFVYTLTRLRRFNDKHITIVYCSMALLVLALSAATIKSDYHMLKKSILESRQTIFNIADAAKANKVSFIVTGDTTGSAVRFWTNGAIRYASFRDCKSGLQMTHNAKRSWFTEPIEPAVSKKHPMGLVIDRTRLDAPYTSGCTKDVIKQKYGEPLHIVAVHNPNGTEYIELWLYDQDIRPRFHSN